VGQLLKTISALKARKNLGEVLEEVFYNRNHFIIKRGNKPMAVIISVPEYETFRRQKEKGFNLHEATAEKNKPIPPAQPQSKRESIQVQADEAEEIRNHLPGSDIY
jgi:prevent-host-death family protein